LLNRLTKYNKNNIYEKLYLSLQRRKIKRQQTNSINIKTLKNMEKRFLVIKDTILLIVVKKWSFDLELLDYVKSEKAQTLYDDFCEANNLDKTKFFWEITK
jgi:hypothetical protein